MGGGISTVLGKLNGNIQARVFITLTQVSLRIEFKIPATSLTDKTEQVSLRIEFKIPATSLTDKTELRNCGTISGNYFWLKNDNYQLPVIGRRDFYHVNSFE